jgi:hypothetical protein
MKTFLIVGGFFIIIFVCLIPLPRDIAEYNTQRNGITVNVMITKVPNCIGTRISQYIKFRYNNEIYSKRVGAPCDEYRVGSILKLKHTPDTDIFLYENEKKEKEFVSAGLLALAGFTFIIIGFKKRKVSIKTNP